MSCLRFVEFSTITILKPKYNISASGMMYGRVYPLHFLIWFIFRTQPLVTSYKTTVKMWTFCVLNTICTGISVSWSFFLHPSDLYEGQTFFYSSFQISFIRCLCLKFPRAKWKYVTLSPPLQWTVELQHCCQCQMPALIKPEARWQLSTLEPAF